MAQVVKGLPGKPEVPSLNPQPTHENLGLWSVPVTPRAGKVDTEGSLELTAGQSNLTSELCVQ